MWEFEEEEEKKEKLNKKVNKMKWKKLVKTPLFTYFNNIMNSVLIN